MCPIIWSSRPSITWCRWRSSRSEPRIHAAQHQSFADVRRRDRNSIVEIGDRARHSQHPLARPSGERKVSHCSRKHALTRVVRPTPALHLGIGEPRVTGSLARKLPAPRQHYALCDPCRRLAGRARDRREVAGCEPGYLDLHIEPVEERSRDARVVGADLARCAATVCCSISVTPTWARIHGRNQLKTGGVTALDRRAGYAHDAALEWLTQRLQRRARELGQL